MPKEVHWEAVLCDQDGTWCSMFFLADNEEQIEQHLKEDEFRKVLYHFIVNGPDDGWNWPDGDDFEGFVDLRLIPPDDYRFWMKTAVDLFNSDPDVSDLSEKQLVELRRAHLFLQNEEY